jgi:topoisomerase IA-like protein
MYTLKLQSMLVLKSVLVVTAKFPYWLTIFHLVAMSRYIAKTLYGDEDEEASPQNNSSVEEPKLLGINPGSTEKVCIKYWSWN